MEALNFFIKKSESILWVRGEYWILAQVIKEQQELASSLEEAEIIATNRQKTITYFTNQIEILETATQGGCKEKWGGLGKQTRNKDPFNYLNLKITLTNVAKYIFCIEQCGNN